MAATYRRGPTFAQRALTHLALLMICAGFLLPVAWMIATSLKSNSETNPTAEQLAANPSISLLPQDPQFENYAQVVRHPRFDMPLYARNTLWVALLAVAGMTLSSSLVAYGFAKIRFRGRGVLFALMLATMMIPFPVVMVSLFSVYRWVGDHTPLQMLGTFRPLWLPAWFGSAFNIFLLRQFYRTIPEELSEAARIDGCSEMGIYLRVILPLSRPALVVVGLFTFMWAWNDFLAPLVYLQYPEQYTLSLGLQAFQSQHGGTSWNLLMGASLLILLPVIILFFLAQRVFIQGISTTGIKS